MTRKVACVGSTTFPLTTAIGAQIVDAMREFGDDTVFLTRGSGPFEQFVATVALTLGLRCLAYLGKGRDNLERDAELAADCDELLAFLDPAQLDTTKTGTAHVIDCAIAASKPVRVATVVAGELVWAA